MAFCDDLVYGRTAERTEQHSQGIRDRRQLGVGRGAADRAFFQQKRLDKLFGEYREKVQHQRETGQIVSDIDEVLNEDVLALYTWRGVIAQIPGT